VQERSDVPFCFQNKNAMQETPGLLATCKDTLAGNASPSRPATGCFLMATKAIPDEIRRFITTNIPSIPYLEALLLLRGDVRQPWSPQRLARSLYVNEITALTLLKALLAGGMVVADGTSISFRYQPSSDVLRQVIDALAVVYATNLVDVTHLVHDRTGRKAQRFADAFVWRKDS
jgi:hypothetical protein